MSKLKEDKATTNALARFYLGSLWNPRYLGIDLKMLLYLIGAVTLQLVILSGLQVYLHSNNNILSNAILVYVACFTWFLTEYMFFENVHLYTYDLFAEKLGFKLTWGCLVFYPFFYPIGIHSIIASVAPEHRGANGSDISSVCAVGIAVLFLAGWIITRGANM